MRIKYIQQEETYTCGPASIKMVFHSLHIKKSEKFLSYLLRTRKGLGTYNKDFPRLAERFKLNYIVNRNSSTKFISNLLNNGYKVIVCYFLEEENTGHYAVVKGIDKKNIYLFDPYLGPKHLYNLKKFNKIWRNCLEKEKRWLIGIKK